MPGGAAPRGGTMRGQRGHLELLRPCPVVPEPDPSLAELTDGFYTPRAAQSPVPSWHGALSLPGWVPAPLRWHRGMVSATDPSSAPLGCSPGPEQRAMPREGRQSLSPPAAEALPRKQEGMRFWPPKMHCRHKCFVSILFLPARRFLILS